GRRRRAGGVCRAGGEGGGRGGLRRGTGGGGGVGAGGRLRESEPVETPPHPTCVASQRLRSQVDLSPHAGRGGVRCASESTKSTPSLRRLGVADVTAAIAAHAHIGLLGVGVEAFQDAQARAVLPDPRRRLLS